jgi:hypothetical protein
LFLFLRSPNSNEPARGELFLAAFHIRDQHSITKTVDLGLIDYNGGIEIHSSLLNVVSTIKRGLGEAFDELESGDAKP